jgi:hypothetical protein
MLVALTPTPVAGEEDDWKHARTKAGVAVHTRAVPGSIFKEFRATGVVPAPMARVVAWWHDPTTFTQWIDSCVEARSVDAGEGVRASYLKFDLPFPASDRDVVLRAVEIESTPDRVVMESRSTDGVVPEVDGLVRIPMMIGRWEFRARDERSTAITYRQHMDAGGRIPAFVLNRATPSPRTHADRAATDATRPPLSSAPCIRPWAAARGSGIISGGWISVGTMVQTVFTDLLRRAIPFETVGG